MNYYHINTFTHSHIHAFFLPYSWVLCAFYVTITYLLKTSALRTRVIQDGKLLIFNSKVGDPSVVLRRSLGDIFLPYISFSIPFQVVIIKHSKNYFCHVAGISYFCIANNYMLNNGRIF